MNVQFDHAPVTRESAKKYVAVLKNVINLAKVVSKFTPTTTDDKMLADAEWAIALLEPHLDQDWVYDLINAVVDLFKTEGPKAAGAFLLSSVQMFAAK